jgi:lipopolysaccharide biosynthesis regulator YciM
MADKKRPRLTDEQIRTALYELTKNLMLSGAESRALEIALLQKGLLTESEIHKAKKQVALEMKKQLDKIAAAILQKPPGGIQ